MKKNLLYAALFAVVILLSACNKDSPTEPSPINTPVTYKVSLIRLDPPLYACPTGECAYVKFTQSVAPTEYQSIEWQSEDMPYKLRVSIPPGQRDTYLPIPLGCSEMVGRFEVTLWTSHPPGGGFQDVYFIWGGIYTLFGIECFPVVKP